MRRVKSRHYLKYWNGSQSVANKITLSEGLHGGLSKRVNIIFLSFNNSVSKKPSMTVILLIFQKYKNMQ